MKLRWTPEAALELEEIHEYLLRNQPELALSTVRNIYQAALSLRKMPLRGRVGRRPGTRELLVLPMPYFVIYRVDESALTMLGVRHTSRDFMPH